MEKALVILLRIGAVTTLSALVPAVMPFAWMDAIHRGMGMGPLPDLPIVGYLTRSLSAMYALHGALLLYVSLDVRRWLPIVRVLALLALVFGAGLLVLDVSVRLPWPWTVAEGPFVLALGAMLLWLAGRVAKETSA